MLAARNKAKEQGLVRYQPHIPCNNGHHSERYTKYNTCIACLKDWRLRNKESVNEKSTSWQKRNREHMRNYHRIWRENNAERWEELMVKVKQRQKVKKNNNKKN